MSVQVLPPVSVTRPPSARAAVAARAFHSAAAALLLVLTFVGFHPFYAHGRAHPGRELAPPIRSLLIVHGVGMTLWMLLSVVQPVLVLVRRRRVHRTLGTAGAALAVTLTVVGGWVGIASARIAPPDLQIWGLTSQQFVIVPLSAITAFATFVALGVWQRTRPDAHRAMMLLATLAAVSAAVGRIDAVNAPFFGTALGSVFGPFLTTLLVGGALLAVRCALTRSVERWFAGGYLALAAYFAAVTALGPTGAWTRIAAALVG